MNDLDNSDSELNELSAFNDDFFDKRKFEDAKRLFCSKEISSNERGLLLKLLVQYSKLKNLDIITKEKEIYEHCEIYNDIDKILFELERIRLVISGRNEIKPSVLSEYETLVKFMDLDKTKQINIDDVDSKGILESVVMIELELEMPIGLYSDVHGLFLKKYNYYCNVVDYDMIKRK